MARKRINSRNRTKEKPYMINLQFLQNWEGKQVNRESKTRVSMLVGYVLKEFCVVSLVTKKVKSRSIIAPFFLNWAPFWNLISIKANNLFFIRKLSELYKKRHNFACDICISPKTRGNKNKQWTHLGALQKLLQWTDSYFALDKLYSTLIVDYVYLVQEKPRYTKQRSRHWIFCVFWVFIKTIFGTFWSIT